MSKTKVRPRMYATRIDLSEERRIRVIEILNGTLANTFDLWSQIKQAHWNVKGKDFYQLHLLFDDIAGELYEFIDTVAERITALGGYARGTARMAAADSSLSEYDIEAVDGKDHLLAVADRLAQYCQHVRQTIDTTNELGDMDTADLYTEISRAVDKKLWFLEAHLQS